MEHDEALAVDPASSAALVVLARALTEQAAGLALRLALVVAVALVVVRHADRRRGRPG